MKKRRCIGCGGKFKPQHDGHYWCNQICFRSHAQREGISDFPIGNTRLNRWATRHIQRRRKQEASV
jgi:hypothetical protein